MKGGDRTLKRNAVVCLFLIACLLLAACSGSGVLPSAAPPTSSLGTGSATPTKTAEPSRPEDVLQAYMDAVSARDYEKMYSLISSSSGISKEDFIARNKKIYEGMEAKNLKIEIEKGEQSDSLSFQTTMDTAAGQISFSNQATLEQEGGVAKLKWNAGLIFPDLGDTDKVRVETLKAERGSILDRNGKLLAGRDKVYSVGFVPGKIDPQTREQDIAKVAELLGMSVDGINGKLAEKWVKDDLFVPLKEISYTDADLKEQLLKIKGIALNTAQDRVYPLGEAAAHLTGYIHNISQEELDAHKDQGYEANSKIGKVGLENLLEDRLRAVDGCRITIVDQDGKVKKTMAERAAVNGQDVTLTIDATLQAKLYGKMKADKGAAVVMDPKTGEILALVSTPSYDPNNFILGLTDDTWATYNDETTRPMYNRFKTTYVPGSAFKPITAAIGLSNNSFSAADDFGASGLTWQKDSTWGSYHVTTLDKYSGAANVLNAIIYSDNIYFAKAALKIGASTFAEGLKNVGFGEDVPFDFGLSQSTFGSNLSFGSEVELADSGYGQGKILVNPVHMASIYTAFANNGNMMAPHLEKGTEPQVWKKDVFSAEAVQTVRDAMIQAVENPKGTGHTAKISGVKIAGKTGTAEIKDSKQDTTGTEMGWFVAYTADDNADKQYLALAVVEDVKDRGGSKYVIPIVRSIFAD